MLCLAERGGTVQERTRDRRGPIARARAQLVLVAAAVDPKIIARLEFHVTAGTVLIEMQLKHF